MLLRTLQSFLKPILMFFLITFVLGLPGCASKDKNNSSSGPSKNAPDWVRTKKHPDYPEAEYLVGYGSDDLRGSDAKNAATLRARTAIAQQIEVKIKDEIKSIIRETSNDQDSKLSFDISNVSEQEVQALFRGSFSGAEYEDPNGSTHVLVVLHRPTIIDQFLKDAEQGVRDASDDLDNAQKALEDGNPGRALESTLGAVSKSTEAQKNAARAIGIRRDDSVKERARNLKIGDVIQRATNALSSLRGQIEIIGLGGDGQLGAVNAALGPMRVKAQWNQGGQTIPLGRFPIRVVPTHKDKANIVASERTNVEGVAQAKLSELQLTGEEVNKVRFELDYSSYAGKSADAYGVTFTMTYEMPTIDNSAVLVAIDEKINNEDLGQSQAANKIESALRQQGFPLLKGDRALSADDIDGLGTRALREKLSAHARYVITGRVYARHEGRDGRLEVCVADVDLRIVELVSGQSLTLFIDSTGDDVEGFSRDSIRDAGRKAIANALKSQKIASRLVKILKSRLSGGDFEETR